MKKIFFIACLCFALALTTNAQVSNILGAGNEVLKEKEYLDVKGSPYLFENWESGFVTDGTGKTYSNLLIKYNSYKDVIEVKEKDRMIALDNKLYRQFTVSYVDKESDVEIKRTFRNGFTDIPGTSSQNYFEILYDGKYMLLKKIKTDLMEENVSNYGTGGVVKRFSTLETYFLLPPQRKAQAMSKLNKNNMIEALGSDGSKLEAYIAKEKVKLKTEKAFVLALAYVENQP